MRNLKTDLLILQMKNLLLILYLLISIKSFSQTDIPKRVLLSFSLGTIRHEVSTKSENNRIQGISAFDYVLEIAVTYNRPSVKNHKKGTQ